MKDKENNDVSDQSIDSGLAEIKYKLNPESPGIFGEYGIIYRTLKEIHEKLDFLLKILNETHICKKQK